VDGWLPAAPSRSSAIEEDDMRISQTVIALFMCATVLAAAPLAAEEKAEGAAMKSLGAKTLAQPCPVWVIGSYDAAGKPNVMTASWASICNSQPPMVTVSLRKATYTYGSIMASNAFTVNIPSEEFVKEAAYFGGVSGKDVDKFATSGLTPVKSALVNAPYVKEFPLVLECKLVKTVELGLHTMFIGEIVDVKAAESILGANGMPDVAKLRPFIFAPGNAEFYGIGASIGSGKEEEKEQKK
jgi:flavin reductase (DIM6/NTAB) family NADH-FMN oxidoreductase RutF